MSQRLAIGEFLGEKKAQYQGSGFVLSELCHRRARHLPEHTHASAYYCLLLAGDYCERFGSRTLEYNRSAAAFHPAGFTHRDHVGPCGGRFFTVEVQQVWRDRLAEEYSGVALPAGFVAGHAAVLLWRLYGEYREWGTGSALTAEGLVLELLAETAQARTLTENPHPASLKRVREFVHAHLRESLTVEGVAAAVGLHPVYLSRIFRRAYGRTLGEYVNQLRLEFVCQELRAGAIPLAELAQDAGFADQSHLNRVFRRLLATTPARFRARLPTVPTASSAYSRAP